MKIRTSHSPLAFFTRQRDDASPFLVLKSEFAVRSQRIPCYVAREFIGNYLILRLIHSSGSSPKAPKAAKFPVLFLLAGNLDLADGFGQDYVHRQQSVNRAKP
jgi:hypothetical protein